jgi:hypothetical protein
MKKQLFAAGAVIGLAGILNAGIFTTGLTGNTSYDGWDSFATNDIPNYSSGTWPGFFGTGDWPTPIGSNEDGSGDAEFDKVSGYGYPLTSANYIYVGTLSGTGVFAVTDNTVISDIETLVFAIQYGDADGSTSLADGIALTINGSTAVDSGLVSSYNLGSSVVSSDYGDATVQTMLYQWDLTSITEEISSVSLSFTMAAHGQIYGLQLEQSDTYAAVPEPATAMMLTVAGGIIALVRRLRLS